MMQMLSDQFLENMMNNLTSKIDQSLRSIEKQYAIRARYVSKKNACIYANIAPTTLDKWLAKGLAISKIDGCYRIDIQDIDKFIEENKLGKQKSKDG